MPFSEGSQVDVEQVNDTNWRLTGTLEYQGRTDHFVVPAGMLTDFASVPRPFVWFLPRYGRYTKAAILHDYLWRERAANGLMRWADADGLFRRAMRELGVPFLRRWIMWAAVRWAALFKKGGRTGWLPDAPRVLLVTLFALPIVAPPGAVILVALFVFYLAELVAWAPLKANERAMVRLGRHPRKQVNLPTLRWKL